MEINRRAVGGPMKVKMVYKRLAFQLLVVAITERSISFAHLGYFSWGVRWPIE